jgi:hypothetical protein
VDQVEIESIITIEEAITIKIKDKNELGLRNGALSFQQAMILSNY